MRKLVVVLIAAAVFAATLAVLPAKPTEATEYIEMSWYANWGYAQYNSWYVKNIVTGSGGVHFVAYNPYSPPSGIWRPLPFEAVFSVDPASAFRVNGFQMSPGGGKNSFVGMNFGGCLPGPTVEIAKYTSSVDVHVLNTTGSVLAVEIGGQSVSLVPGAYYLVSGLPIAGRATVGCVGLWWNWLWLTPSPTPTRTPEASNTPSPTPSPTATPTVTASQTVTLTASPTMTATVTATATRRVKSSKTPRPSRTPRLTTTPRFP